MDLGTEPAHRVAGKLDDYAALVQATGDTGTTGHAVLFHLQWPGRKQPVHHSAVTGGHLTVATTNAETSIHPAALV